MYNLTAARLRTLAKPGLYSDGGNLYLQVRGPAQRSWLFRYMIGGKARSMGLGPADDISLADARNKADAARALLKAGTDPREQRDTERTAAIVAKVNTHTFREAVDHYLAAHAAGWRAPKHRRIWSNSIATYADPIIGALPVKAVDTNLVLKVIEPLWYARTETASRLRGRIEVVLSYAIARGWRDGPNPAVWRGHLQNLLPQRAKVQPVKHHPALDWREAPGFMAKLREDDSVGAKALQFTILTGARSGEVRGATWSEIDLDAAVWSLPAQRTKAGRPHRVPLTRAALDLLAELRLLKVDDASLIFPGQARRGQATRMTDVTMAMPLRRMERSDVTVHGFRSTFRDWAAETTAYPNHVVELALAHAIGDKVEAAYRRGDLFEKRIALMADWAAYLGRPLAEVVAFNRGQVAMAG